MKIIKMNKCHFFVIGDKPYKKAEIIIPEKNIVRDIISSIFDDIRKQKIKSIDEMMVIGDRRGVSQFINIRDQIEYIDINEDDGYPD